MPFIRTPERREADRRTSALYEAAIARHGYLPNMIRIFGHAPEVHAAWQALATAVSGRMTPRRYELVTMAAARELESSYCLLAHGRILLGQGMTAEEVAEVGGGAGSGLSDQERAVMAFAAQVVRAAGEVTAADVQGLRDHGLSEPEIFEVAAAAALRCFFSKTLDALGAEPDRAFSDLPEVMRAALQPGRRIEDGPQTPA